MQSEECGCAVGLRNGLLLAGFAASVGQMVRKRWALVPKASSGATPRVIESSIEVAVPVSVAYSQWTQFEEFPGFMQGVDVRQLDDTRLHWVASVGGRRAEWDAKILEQHPNQLTWIELNVDFQPEGVFEKLASGLRFHRRAIKTDLQRYKAFAEMRNEETGAWRGEIHDEDENPAREATKGHESQEESNGNSSSDESSRKEREERRKQRREAATSK